MTTTESSYEIICFGVFEADLRSGELRRNGARVKIQDLPFRALRLLLSHPGQIFSREEFRQTLWPEGVYVDFDHGISSAINRLRDALGDSAAQPVFIQTVGRRGYRWIAASHASEPPLPPASKTIAEMAAAPHVGSQRWGLVSVLPVLVVLFAALIFRTGNQNQTTAAPHPTNSPAPDSHPANAEAGDFYLQGRFYWNQRSAESLNKAVDLFTQAIVRDPNYAPAYVGLADCYNLLREYSIMPASEAYPRALAAAKKAVELDGQSSEAHASLAFVSFYGMWDAAMADREFHRALALNPGNAIAHHWYATYLMSLNHNPESLVEIERAQGLDPDSKSVLADKGLLLFYAGRQQEAITLLTQMEKKEPSFISPHRYLKYVYFETADYPHYLMEARQEAVLMHDNPTLVIEHAAEKGFATLGPRGLLEAQRQQQKKLYDRGQFSPYALAATYSLLGSKQEALQYLETAYDQHADGVPQIESDPAFRNLHNEPAFRQLLARLGLPPIS
jgi:DNA-binding winged helix-turn-helix (wHTH) protein/tetratricopeptide (TPR) repeat protein